MTDVFRDVAAFASILMFLTGFSVIVSAI